MTINEIKDSGLLELYILGLLEGEELLKVEQALIQYPELKRELKEIEQALQGYAQANGITPNPSLKGKILKNITDSTSSSETPPSSEDTKKSTSTLNWGLIILLTLLTAIFGYLWYQATQNNKAVEDRYKLQIAECDSIQQANEIRQLAYESITGPNVELVAVTATPKYPETQLYFYHNPVAKKNFIKLNNLPAIDQTTQSYQLWSIKGDNPPTPLDVFQGQGTDLLEVKHIDATEVYAITIEAKGGKDTPDLDNLIGTFSI